MIAKHFTTKSFDGIVAYNEKPNKGHLLGGNFEADNQQERIDIFNQVCLSREHITVKAYHLVVALDPSDRGVRDDEFLAIGEEFITNMQFANDKLGRPDFPYLIYRHTDTKHPHIHIVMSRVTFGGGVINDSHNFRRGMKVCQMLEQKYGLRVTPNRQQFVEANTKQTLLAKQQLKPNNLPTKKRRILSERGLKP
jgi:hypothetical protein